MVWGGRIHLSRGVRVPQQSFVPLANTLLTTIDIIGYVITVTIFVIMIRIK